jgi:hypothetical protein
MFVRRDTHPKTYGVVRAELRVNADGRTPKRVLALHPSDEVADLAVDSAAAATLAGLPAPIHPKAAPTPADHGLGLDHRRKR